MKKIKNEFALVVGANKKLQESDIDNLPYLHAIVQETLRLHPPVPLLVPRKAVRDTNFMGYSIPKSTLVMVNLWAIGRDEGSWEDAWKKDVPGSSIGSSNGDVWFMWGKRNEIEKGKGG
ncbi:hypothetical protein AgCh_029489 [Apium graveolens]